MPNCRKNVNPFVNLDNCTFESGRINAIAFVEESKAALADETPSLWSTASFWTSETYSADILIHDEVDGEYTGAAVKGAGKGTQQERTIGKNHTATVHVESVKGNNDYWDDLAVSTNYRFVFVGDNYSTLFVSTANVSIDGEMVLQNDISSINEWEVIVTWSDIKLPESYDVPVGIFN
jgi:hypothetical protein